jgi:hypothetical protein
MESKPGYRREIVSLLKRQRGKKMNDNKDLTNDQDKFFQDLIDVEENDEDDEEVVNNETEESEEEKAKKAKEAELLKNKNAEEARKRREAEAKAKAEAEAKAAEEKAKAESEAKAKAESEAKLNNKKQSQVAKLGDELVHFKQKYPDIDLASLDKDKNFKKYIDDKLLGKKDFTALYEEYIEIRQDLSGKTKDEIYENYRMKAQSSSGTATPAAAQGAEYFSQEELEKLSTKLPLMNDQEASKIFEKFEKSVNYYKNKK